MNFKVTLIFGLCFFGCPLCNNNVLANEQKNIDNVENITNLPNNNEQSPLEFVENLFEKILDNIIIPVATMILKLAQNYFPDINSRAIIRMLPSLRAITLLPQFEEFVENYLVNFVPILKMFENTLGYLIDLIKKGLDYNSDKIEEFLPTLMKFILMPSNTEEFYESNMSSAETDEIIRHQEKIEL